MWQFNTSIEKNITLKGKSAINGSRFHIQFSIAMGNVERLGSTAGCRGWILRSLWPPRRGPRSRLDVAAAGETPCCFSYWDGFVGNICNFIYIYIIYVSCDILLLLLFLFIISIYYCRLFFLLLSIIYYYLFLLLWNACLFTVGDMLIYSFFAIYNQPPVESIIYRYIVGICKSGFIRSYIANI
jgi:hypothetical protein